MLDKVSFPVKYFPCFSFFFFLYRIKVAEEIIHSVQRKGISGIF